MNIFTLWYSLHLDPEYKKFMDKYLDPLRGIVKAVIAQPRFPLLHANFAKHEFESNLGNLISDAVLDYVRITKNHKSYIILNSVRGTIS